MKALAAAAVLLLAGCVGNGNVPAMQYYVLGGESDAARVRPASQRGQVLLVQPTSSAAFYDTQRLAFSRTPGQRAYYQFAAWTERPGRAFGERLLQRLDAVSTTSGVRGDLVLLTRLEELYHDASTEPGAARVAVSAELVDAAGRLVGEPRRFVRSVPARAANAAAAVDAANRALAEVLDEIAAWMREAAQRPVTAKRG
jgi:cholesterol transport system auxiliary component